MKNIKTILHTGLCVFALMFIFTAAAYAANGDVAGNIYSTDILAVVNGFPMESYNIGGKTAVIAEDLSDKWYGFDHAYSDSDRTLYVWSSLVNSPDVDTVDAVTRGLCGALVGNFYETDIKVVFNGHEVPGYNIGGKTVVCIEDLGTPDDSVNAQYGYTKYLCNFTYNNDTRVVTLDSLMDNEYRVIRDIESEHIEYRFISENVIEPVYDPMIYNFEIRDMKNLQPLYFSINGNLTEIGLCYVQREYGYDYADVHCIIDYDKANNAVLSQLKKEILPYDEALKLFYESGQYNVYDRCENDKYTVLLVKAVDADIQRADESDIDFFRRNMYKTVLLKKSGGYCTVNEMSDGEQIIMTFISEDELQYTRDPDEPTTLPLVLNFSFDNYAN